MKKLSLYAALSFLMLTIGCTSVSRYKRIGYDFSKTGKMAVINIESGSLCPAARNKIIDYATIELANRNYDLVEGPNTEAVIADMNLASEDAMTEVQAIQIGKAVGAEQILVIEAPCFNGSLDITAKMINLADTDVLWMSIASGCRGKWWDAILGAPDVCCSTDCRGDDISAGTAKSLKGLIREMFRGLPQK